MTPLTDRQTEVLAFIEGYAAAHGYPPTHKEIGSAIAVQSNNGVNEHLRALERKGYIRRVPMASRGITILRSRGIDPVEDALKAFSRLTPGQRLQFLRRITPEVTS